MKRKIYFISIFLIVSLFLFFYACPSPVEKEKVATPVIRPNGGFYSTAQTITITCETEGATIYYTTDGNEPTTSSSKYEGSFIIVAGTVKAMAAKDNYLNSDITSQTYYLMSGIELTSEYPWTKFLGNTSKDEIQDLAIDNDGNIYITGRTTSSLGSETNNGGEDIFIAKYSSKGTLLWLHLRGGSDNDCANALALDSSNNIYLTGYTASSFDGNQNQGKSDVFLIKYDKNGNWIWTKFKGSSEVEEGNDIEIDGTNNIYIVGQTKGNFDGQTIDKTSDILILKYSTDGNHLKTQFEKDGFDENGFCIAIDSSNNIYIGGSRYNDYLYFYDDIYIAKFNSSLTREWKIHEDIAQTQIISDIKIDNSNNIYVVGTTKLEMHDQNFKGVADIFLIKYDINGNRLNTWLYGGDDGDYGLGIYIDSENNKYITGHTSSSFNGQTNKGYKDIVIIKLDSSDNYVYTKFKGGIYNDWGISILVKKVLEQQILYIAGSTFSSFDGQTNNGDYDGFIIKYIEP